MSSRDDNIATQEKAAERLNAGDVDAGVDIMFAPDAVDHDPAPIQEQGREGYRRFFHYLVSAFPDFTITPERMVADDDSVAFAYTLTGTHQGEFEGVAATGRRIEVRGLQLGRFENGQIVERWGATDMATLLSQIQA
ncbi:ester cyclase [Actinomycetospora termitidis]|uniref:Ester cyclase n=1 Tax=Actinomycetospora termitidis TaxID=3053470 RepID=A0ABT7MI61_9PSEU|nr:ester cyclase [Actinomycetospora sp. Odt1-22]MDL5159627.1 ester cyclase [Actinomycetospora sp. Odt1-22]